MRARLLPLLCLLLLAPAARANEHPEEIVRRMLAAYARLESYRDAGFTRITPESGEQIAPGRWTTQRTFETLFRSGVGFRFEYITDRHDAKDDTNLLFRWNLCAHDSAFTIWFYSRRTEPSDNRPQLIRTPEKNATLGLAGLTGVTDLTASYISSLLLDETTAHRNLGLRNPIYWAGDEDVEGIPCVHLRITNPWGMLEFWVARKDWLIRRVVTTGSRRIEVQITALSTDAKLSRADFAVDPSWFGMTAPTREAR